jgi:hypothetical protein
MRSAEAGFSVRVHPDPGLILIRAQILALIYASKSKFIRAQTLTLLDLDKKTGLRYTVTEPPTAMPTFLPSRTIGMFKCYLQVTSIDLFSVHCAHIV